MTEQEFDNLLRQWTRRVKMSAEGKLLAGTHGTGKLLASLADYVDKMRDNVGRHIAYKFEAYGVFRTYGAGRGWVVINGKPVPGRRVVSLKNLRTNNWRKLSEVKAMRKRGFLDKDIKKAKVLYDDAPIKERKPLDWLDGIIKRNYEELANIAVQYFGDVALQSLAQSIDKAKINKYGN